jgi:polyisoprenoid-binding protein YceI
MRTGASIIFNPIQITMSKVRLIFFFSFCCNHATCDAAMFQVDPANSTAYFEVGYFAHGMVKGTLSKISGKVTLGDMNKKGSADISFDMTTVETGHQLTNSFIKSKNIFHTNAYPTMRFHAAQFEFDGPQLISVSGNLTLHGVTRAIGLEAKRFTCGETVAVGPLPQTCHCEFSTVIHRRQFGMGRFPFLVNDEVSINATLTLERVAP